MIGGDPRACVSDTELATSTPQTAQPDARKFPSARALQNLTFDEANVRDMSELSPHSVRFVPRDFDGELVFNSRNHRKGRFPKLQTKSKGDHVHRHNFNLLTFEPDNVSWWVAVAFAVGSVFWVVNGVRVLDPGESGGRRNFIIESVAACFAGLIFELGAWLAIVEAINPRRHLDFGYEVTHPVNGHRLGTSIHLHPRARKPPADQDPRWRWFALEFHDSGTRAASARFIGATAVALAVVLALPRADASADTRLVPESNVILFDVLVIGLQVVGSLCFLYTAVVLMLETQHSWREPNLRSLGWHLNVWFGFGAFNFLLSALFDVLREVDGEEVCCQKYGTHLCQLLGGLGFLLGSLLLLVEVANKHPS